VKLDDASHNLIAGGLGWDALPPFLHLNDQRKKWKKYNPPGQFVISSLYSRLLLSSFPLPASPTTMYNAHAC
jgi:hypothetical protein